jgi:ribonuclease Z
LADLLLTSWIWQRPHKLQVSGPRGIETLTEHISQAYQSDMQYRASNTGLNPDMNVINSTALIEDTIVYQQDGITITAFLVDHGVVKPAFGYKIESDDNTVVVSGDTTYSENLIKHAMGSRLLIHEIAAASPTLLEKNSRLQKVMSYHTDPQQLAEVLGSAEPDLTVLNHVLLFGMTENQVIDKVKSLYAGEVMMGKDLVKIGIGEKITVRGEK